MAACSRSEVPRNRNCVAQSKCVTRSRAHGQQNEAGSEMQQKWMVRRQTAHQHMRGHFVFCVLDKENNNQTVYLCFPLHNVIERSQQTHTYSSEYSKTNRLSEKLTNLLHKVHCWPTTCLCLEQSRSVETDDLRSCNEIHDTLNSQLIQISSEQTLLAVTIDER